jgi:hypothetical protein
MLIYWSTLKLYILANQEMNSGLLGKGKLKQYHLQTIDILHSFITFQVLTMFDVIFPLSIVFVNFKCHSICHVVFLT